MKILMISKNVPTRYQGGIQTHVWKLSKYMVRQGHKVDILSAGSFKQGNRTYEEDGRTIHEIRYLPGRHIPVLNLFLEDYFFNKRVLKWIKKYGHSYDLINVQGRSGFLYPAFNKAGKYPPSITTFHGTANGEYISNKNFASNKFAMYLHKLFSTQQEQNCLRYSNAVIAVSNEMRTRLSNEFGESLNQSQLIYNGIDLDDYLDISEQEDENLLLFVGRLTAIKGIHILIEALSKVKETVELVVVGGGPDEKKYKAQVGQLNLSHRITFTGSLPFSEVRKWLQKSYAFAMPSFHESQGIVAMEANAFGKPVVASNINGINEVLTDNVNGLLFEKANVTEMAEKINQLFSDKELAKRLGLEGRKIMKEKFDWEILTKETLKLYAKVIEEN